MTIKQLIKICHAVAIKKGFWDKCKYCKGTGKIKILYSKPKIIENDYFKSVEEYKKSIKIEKCDFCKGRGNLINRNEGEMIALMHSELSEVLEALRNGNPKSKKIPKFLEVEEEYADLIIRVADICGAKGYRLNEAIEAKIKYNKKRPFKHGKAF